MRRPEVPTASSVALPVDAQMHVFLTRYRRAARHATWGEIQAVLPSSVHGQAIADIVVADLLALVTLGACSQRVLHEVLLCFRRRVTINYAAFARWAHKTKQEVLWEFRSCHDLLVWEKQAEAIPLSRIVVPLGRSHMPLAPKGLGCGAQPVSPHSLACVLARLKVVCNAGRAMLATTPMRLEFTSANGGPPYVAYSAYADNEGKRRFDSVCWEWLAAWRKAYPAVDCYEHGLGY